MTHTNTEKSSTDNDCAYITTFNVLIVSAPILSVASHIWDKVFKNGPNKICGRQSLRSLKGYVFHFAENCQHNVYRMTWTFLIKF